MAVQRKQLTSSITKNMTPSAIARYNSHIGRTPLSVHARVATATDQKETRIKFELKIEPSAIFKYKEFL